jgi:hypothetical protein
MNLKQVLATVGISALTTLGVVWGYNSYLKNSIQPIRQLLNFQMNWLNVRSRKRFSLGAVATSAEPEINLIPFIDVLLINVHP